MSPSFLKGVLIAAAAGVLAFAYVDRRASGRRLGKAENELASMRNFVANLTAQDVALQKELISSNAELNRRVLQLASLFEIGRELMSMRRPDEVLHRIPELASRLIPSTGSAIRILSREGSRLVIRSHFGLSPEYMEENRSVPVDSSPIGQVVRLKKPFAGVGGEEVASTHLEDMGPDGMTFVLSAPLVVRGEIAGVLSVYTPNIHDRTRDEIRLLSVLAVYTSAALENAELHEELGAACQELSTLKDYNESILESITIGLAVVDRDLTVTTWNRGMESITGIPREDAVGRSCGRFVAARHEADLVEVLKEVIGKGVTLELENMNQVAPDGREYVVSCRVCPLVISSEPGENDGAPGTWVDSVIGAIIVAEDVTVAVSLRERLRRAERMKAVGEFAAGLAHEVINPIGVISACAEHLAEKIIKTLEHSGEYLKPLKAIEEEAARCSSIIKNLTVFSRHQELHLKPTDIGRLIGETLKFVEPQAAQSGVEIETNEATLQGLPHVLADEAQLRQVFLNLVMNALQAMPAGGSLEVRLIHRPHGRTGGYVIASFSDTGCGIPRENLERIFTPFFTTRSAGVGLGLAISHGIVEAHGGTISVESKEGEGSTFTIRLPVARRAAGVQGV